MEYDTNKLADDLRSCEKLIANLKEKNDTLKTENLLLSREHAEMSRQLEGIKVSSVTEYNKLQKENVNLKSLLATADKKVLSYEDTLKEQTDKLKESRDNSFKLQNLVDKLSHNRGVSLINAEKQLEYSLHNLERMMSSFTKIDYLIKNVALLNQNHKEFVSKFMEERETTLALRKINKELDELKQSANNFKEIANLDNMTNRINQLNNNNNAMINSNTEALSIQLEMKFLLKDKEKLEYKAIRLTLEIKELKNTFDDLYKHTTELQETYSREQKELYLIYSDANKHFKSLKKAIEHPYDEFSSTKEEVVFDFHRDRNLPFKYSPLQNKILITPRRLSFQILPSFSPLTTSNTSTTSNNNNNVTTEVVD